MIRVLRVGIVLIFIITTILFGLFYFKERNSKDDTVPSIEVSTEILDISIHDAEEKLLRIKNYKTSKRFRIKRDK